MRITKEYLKSVQPKNKGESDKYSWNIYRYLKGNIGNDIRIFKSPNGKTEVIGHKYSDGISGCDLDSLIRSTRIQEYWFDDNWNLKEQEGWLEEYQRIGRCLLIPHNYQWYTGEDTRFTYVNNTRKCNWCGKWQHMNLQKIVKVKLEKVWEDD